MLKVVHRFFCAIFSASEFSVTMVLMVAKLKSIVLKPIAPSCLFFNVEWSVLPWHYRSVADLR
jgi:hypothetical protein